MARDWVEIEVQAGHAGPEPAAAALMAAGSAGVSIHEGSPNGRQSAADCHVRGYFPVDRRLDARLDDLRGRLAVLRQSLLCGEGEASIRPLKAEEWATAWRRNYRPFRVGRTLVIRPSWESWPAGPDDRVLALDPGMAFGTGTHPTTRLCLEALEDRVRPGDRLLDWGTGSGILAIAAALLGADGVEARDVDPESVAAARENARLNGVADRVRIRRGDLPARGDFDGVVANILADPILAASPRLRHLVRPGGWLIASGITRARATEVNTALRQAGFAAAKARRAGEWVCLVAVSV